MIERAVDNLETQDYELEKEFTGAMEQSSEDNPDASITTKEEFEEAASKIDNESADYKEDVLELIRETDPEVYQGVVEEQVIDIVENVQNLDVLSADEIIETKDGNGDIHRLTTYCLDSGAEIILEEIDEEDIGTNNPLSPFAGVTKTWNINSSIYKNVGARKVTAKCYMKVGCFNCGTISVCNHYTVNKTNIVMREPDIPIIDCRSPISISICKEAYKSSKTKLKEEGEKFFAGAQFYVTASDSMTLTLDYQFGSISKTISGSKTRLYKLYAYVEALDFTGNGVYVKQQGKVIYEDW